MKKFSNVASIIYRTPWAIEKSWLKTIADIYGRHVSGAPINRVASNDEDCDPDEDQDCPYEIMGSVGVVSIMGPIVPRGKLMNNVSSRVLGSDDIATAVKAAASDPEVASILLNIDSPGGSVLGGFEASDSIYAAKGTKPMIAAIGGMGCSLAYLFASQADAIYCTRGSIVGSIGVYSMRQSEERALKNEGIDTMVVSSTPAKAGIGMTDSQIQEQMQAEVDKYFGMFKTAVARSRPQLDLSSFDPGTTFIGDDAQSAGLVDGIDDMENLVASMLD